MAEAFLSLNARDRKEILETVAARSGQPAVILEKDIWICWVLEILFSIPNHNPMAFKGGTSLSKVYRIIDRFSEDVDITFDYRAFSDGFDPFAADVNKSQIKRFRNRLESSVKAYTQNVVVPALETAAEGLATSGQHRVRINDNGESVWFAYPSSVENTVGYLASEVLLEFGGRNVIDPNERHVITPEIAALTNDLNYPKAMVTVLSPVRTFWEKATLIHGECHRRRLSHNPERISRHWFDLACLAHHDTSRAALSDRAIFEDVVRHKTVFFNTSYANYDHCLDGRLRLVPDEDQLARLRTDYEAMRTAGIVRDEAPRFDALMESVRDVEIEVNRQS